ncbi:MAG: tetratricopeptide repeat protein [Coriobacteriales bacterium]|nr:tetratricopeptide repeat protein [Coriobacteriales bacterium]
MNSTHFERARQSYEKGDYVEALKGFYACLKEDSDSFEPGDAGLLYYRLGNCLLKMRNFQEASATYAKALDDPDHLEKAAVHVNLGKSLIGLGEYERAITSFNSALADPSYSKPYQAQMGLGTAYSRLGMIIDAGTAYRNAALDEGNPNPVKALMQLGVCFVALGRPQDAIEAYQAVFEFEPTGVTRSKAYESLGQSLAAVGRYQEALDAFTAAVSEGRYALSDEALADYQRSMDALSDDTSSAKAVEGMDAVAPEALTGQRRAAPFDPDDPIAALAESEEGYGAGNVPLANNTDFFSVTDADLIAMSKSQIRRERKLRHVGLKVLLAVVVILVLLLGTGVFAYTQGFGFPSQQAVIGSLFADHAAGKDVSQYWTAQTDEEKAAVDHIMDLVAPTDTIEISYLDAQMNKSEAQVVAHLSGGGSLNYRISLERSFIGWKISGLEMIFASQQVT